MEVQRTTFEDKDSGGSDRYHEFIVNLMKHPPVGVRFIQYLGAERVTLPRNLIGIQRTRFVHHFSLCRLQTPHDEEYETRLTEKRQRTSEHKTELKRIELELSFLPLKEYLAVTGHDISTFNIVRIEHTEEKTISSGSSLPSVSKLVELARRNFVKKTPHRTTQVVAVQEEIVEVPSTFLVQGKQRVAYRGIALVLKTEIR